MVNAAERLNNLLELEALLREAIRTEASPFILSRYYGLLREVRFHIRELEAKAA